MQSYNQRTKRTKNNKRLALKRKAKHRERCNKWLKDREIYLNNILFETVLGQVEKDIKYEEIKINTILQKDRLMKDLKQQRILVSLAKKDMIEPTEFINLTKYDIPQLSWYEYLFGK